MKAFISHSYKDHDFVYELSEKLKIDGIDVWVDEWELKAGDSIVQKINDAIIESGFLIIILSENSITSDWVMKELNVGLMRQLSSNKIKILPVLLELKARELPPLLADIFAVSFTRDSISESQYKKLVDPIFKKTKSDKLKNYQDRFFENIQHIDLILRKELPSEQQVSFVLGLIKEKHYFRYFFKKVDKIHWFNILKAEQYFKPSDETRPKEIEEQGAYTIPYWPVLDYLVKISEKTGLQEYEDYADELLLIIRSVTEYHVSNERQLDNFRTWWNFIKILNNLPNEKVSLDDIFLIKQWLRSTFGSDPHGTDAARKLLPKFLKSDQAEDIKKAELLIDIITELFWITLSPERSKALRKEKEPKTAVDTYWLLKAFRQNAKTIAEKCNKRIILLLSDRLLDLLDADHDKTWRTFTYKTDRYALICKKVKRNEFSVIIGSLQSEEAEENDRLFIEDIEPTIKKFEEFMIENCSTKTEFIKKIKSKIENNQNDSELLSIIYEEAEKIYESFFEDYTYIRFPSIYENPSVGESKPDITLITILRDILENKARISVEDTNMVLTSFLSEQFKYPIFKRIVLFVIGNNYENFRNQFVQLLERSDELKLFESSNYQPELYELLKNNVNKFNDKEKELLQQVIEAGPKKYLPENDQEKYAAYWKVKWLLPMNSDPNFLHLYQIYNKIANVKDGKIKYKSGTMIRSGPGPSPLTMDEMLELDVDALAKYFIEFRTKNDWDGPTVGGLAQEFKKTVKANPEKFIDNIESFINCGYIYVYELISAIREIWNKRKEINWLKILVFMERYMKQDGFWENAFIVERGKWLADADTNWIAGILAELLQDGLKDDSWAMPLDQMIKATDIINDILNNIESDEETDPSDFVTYSLNTVYGKAITALIYLALRIKRNLEKLKRYEGECWNTGLKQLYEKLLKNNVIESYTWLGKFAHNFSYLENYWLIKWIEIIQKTKGSQQWEAFINGYFSIGSFNDELYHLLRYSYIYGVKNKFKNEHDNEYIVQYIGLAYLKGIESISDKGSLIFLLLDRCQIEQIQNLISFFWGQRDIVNNQKKEFKTFGERIIVFWRWLYKNKFESKATSSLSKDDVLILSRLTLLTTFLKKIDEEALNWVRLSSKYVDEEYNSSFFVESLNQFKDSESLKNVGKIYLEMLKYYAPDYDKEHIKATIERLYKKNHKEIANKICDEYGKRGYEFLRNLYNKYNEG